MSSRSHNEITRYIDGAMSSNERMRFEARLAGDGNLRALVDAERSIRVAISRDVSSHASEHAATRARMMSALSELPPPPATLPGAGAREAIATKTTSPLLKWLGAAAGGTGVVAAVVVLMTSLGGPDHPGSSARVNDAVRAAGSTSAVSAPASTVESGHQMPDAMEAVSGRNANDVTRDDDARSSSVREQAGSVERAEETVAGPSSVEQPSAEPLETSGAAEAQQQKPKRQLRVIEPDSVRTRVEVDLRKP